MARLAPENAAVEPVMRVMVVGSPRSGTTLLQSLLACHPSVTSFTESHFFTRHYRRFDPGGTSLLVRDPIPRMEEFARENSLAAAPFRLPFRSRLGLPLLSRLAARRFLEYLDAAASSRGAPIWVEKTPGHLWFVARIESAAQGSVRFVHILRDGPAVVTSMLRARRQWGAMNPTVESCIRRWNRDLVLTARRVKGGHDLLVSYDDLTANPSRTIGRLCSALGLLWRPEWIDRRTNVIDRIVTDNEAWKEGTAGAIEGRSSFADSWDADQRLNIRKLLDEGVYRDLLAYSVG